MRASLVTAAFAAFVGLSSASPALPLFNIVRFKNEPCKISTTREGTCYTAAECENLGGKKSSGDCAEGFGVCCEFSDMKCGDTSRQNNTYMVSGTVATSSSCSYHICPANENICRIKFEFTALTLAAPPAGASGAATNAATISRTLGACSDSLKITGGSANASPVICGTNTGQHMIMDSDGETCHSVNINVGSATVTRTWDIRVTHYDCKDMTALENTAGPKGCLQYHLGSATGTGRIDNFNYVGANWPTAPTSPQHLINQDYNICIRRHAQMTRICYTVAATNTNHFGLSHTASTTISHSQIDSTCTSDYLQIPGARIGGDPTIAANAAAAKKAQTAADRLCGRMFNVASANAANAVICTYFSPFMVAVKFDDNELVIGIANNPATDESMAPSGFIGFHITFAQDAPTQPA